MIGKHIFRIFQTQLIQYFSSCLIFQKKRFSEFIDFSDFRIFENRIIQALLALPLGPAERAAATVQCLRGSWVVVPSPSWCNRALWKNTSSKFVEANNNRRHASWNWGLLEGLIRPCKGLLKAFKSLFQKPFEGILKASKTYLEAL